MHYIQEKKMKSPKETEKMPILPEFLAPKSGFTQMRPSNLVNQENKQNW